ncbi:MAG: hypothetical protein GY702_01255 [Desulfobulbaceae bacterium]|nr:hypothetical protein [Desulfobulbaceae bacterium]
MFQTNQLIIVGGPSAVGKTAFLNCMQQKQISDLLNQIPVNNPQLYLYLDAVQLTGVRKSFVDRLVLHYDFIHQYSLQVGFSYLSDLINRSNSVFVLTLCAQSIILSNRISSRLRRIIKTRPFGTQRIERLQKKKEMYDDQEMLLGEFQRWLEYFEEYEIASHMIIDSSKDYWSTWFRDTNEARNILASILAGQKLTKQCS